MRTPSSTCNWKMFLQLGVYYFSLTFLVIRFMEPVVPVCNRRWLDCTEKCQWTVGIVCTVRSPKPEDTNSNSKCGARYFEPAQSVRMATPFTTWFNFIVSDDITLCEGQMFRAVWCRWNWVNCLQKTVSHIGNLGPVQRWSTHSCILCSIDYWV
jgi:hypothetical protein